MRIVLILFISLMAMAIAPALSAADPAAEAQVAANAKCPICGKDVNATVKTLRWDPKPSFKPVYGGANIGFCSDDCRKACAEHPEQYDEKIAKAIADSAPINDKCPMCEKAIGKDAKTMIWDAKHGCPEMAGAKIATCSEECAKALQDEAKNKAALERMKKWDPKPSFKKKY